MHKFSIKIFFITSILWGIGYPQIFRLPLYFFTSILIIVTSNRFTNIVILLNQLEKFNIKKYFKFRKINLLVLPLVFYLFTWNLYSLLYVFCIIVFIICITYFSNTHDLLNTNSIYDLSVISIFIVAISVPFRGSFSEFVSASPGLFPEPSNLGFTIGPVLGVLTGKRNYRPLGFLGILFFSSFCFSRSLWISYLISVFLSIKFKNNFKSVYLSLCILGLIILASFSLYFFADRMVNIYDNHAELSKYSSTLIWYGWLKQSLINLINYPLGIGPFEWIDNIRFLPEALFHENNVIPYLQKCNFESFCKVDGFLITGLNIRDLASLLSFGIASFGALFPVFLFMLIHKLCSTRIQISPEFYTLHPLSVLCISYICTYMFRWTGFTAGPLLGTLCLIGSANLIENNKNSND